MVVYHPRVYSCDFCPNLIEKEEDGFIIFGSLCITSTRGLKAQIGEVPNDTNYNQLGLHKTCICKKCFNKKYMYMMEKTNV